MVGFYTYLAKNFPVTHIDYHKPAKIYISFIVEKDGSISNVTILRGANQRLDKIAVDLIKNSPTWKPGINTGAPHVKCSLPINIR